MKNLILLTLSIFFLFSCDKKEPEIFLHGSWTVNNENFNIQKAICEESNWQGGIYRHKDSVWYNTLNVIEDDQNNSLKFSLHFLDVDSSFLFFSEEKAIELLSPRKIDMSDYPNFYFKVTCDFNGKSYSNFVSDWKGDIISEDFQIDIESLDLELDPDCIGFRNLILAGTFSGTFTNRFDKSEKVLVDNGAFRYLFIRY